MLMIFILLLNSCLLKDNKVKTTLKEYMNLGLLIREKLALRVICSENIKIFLKSERDLVEGIKENDFYKFLFKKEGFYIICVQSDEYFLEEIKVSIFKYNNNFYYRGPQEIKLKKIFKNEPIKITRDKIEEEIIGDKVTELINLDIKMNIVVFNNTLQKPDYISLQPLGNPEIKKDLLTQNSKFVNNDIGDYFEMPIETKQKEKLPGEKLKENLLSHKSLISTCSNIFSEMFLKPSKINEEEIKQEALKRAKDKNEVAKKSNSENENSNIDNQEPEPDPKDIEEIRARRQAENEDGEKVHQRFEETISNTLKNVSDSSKDNKAPEILKKVYELFKK